MSRYPVPVHLDFGYQLQKQYRKIQALWSRPNRGTTIRDYEWRFERWEHRYREKLRLYWRTTKIVNYKNTTPWRKGKGW